MFMRVNSKCAHQVRPPLPDVDRSRAARIPVLATAVLAAAGLLVTVKAAPNMLQLKNGNNDPERLRGSFDGFRSWSSLREAFQALAFGASLWALATNTQSLDS